MTREEAALRCQRLTNREREILQATADGFSTRQVARDLFISTKTVNTHLRNLHGKLGTQSKVQAVVAGIKAGMVQL
jgi:DNA-binding CsgD family transcriptional regulator